MNPIIPKKREVFELRAALGKMKTMVTDHGLEGIWIKTAEDEETFSTMPNNVVASVLQKNKVTLYHGSTFELMKLAVIKKGGVSEKTQLEAKKESKKTKKGRKETKKDDKKDSEYDANGFYKGDAPYGYKKVANGYKGVDANDLKGADANGYKKDGKGSKKGDASKAQKHNQNTPRAKKKLTLGPSPTQSLRVPIMSKRSRQNPNALRQGELDDSSGHSLPTGLICKPEVFLKIIHTTFGVSRKRRPTDQQVHVRVGNFNIIYCDTSGLIRAAGKRNPSRGPSRLTIIKQLP